MAKKDRKSARKEQKQALKSAKNNTASSTEKSSWILLGIALAVTFFLFLPTLDYDYVNWDDDVNITENKNLEGAITGQTFKDLFSLEKGPVIGNYNPLPIVTFALEKKYKGDFDPSLTHWVNLLMHLLCVFFVFRLCLHLGLGKIGAFITALLFGIHPMRVESVTWATERKDVLFALFFFWALIYYVKWIKAGKRGESQGKYYVLMLVLAVFSYFSKVQAVALPLSMLAIDVWMKRTFTLRSVVVEKLPFWALSLAMGLINVYTLSQNASLDDTVTGYHFGHRILIGLYAFCVYLYKLVLPIPMSPLYPYPKEIPWQMFATPVLFAAVWFGIYRLWAMKKGRETVFGMLFFFVNVVFMLQILGAGQGFQADRFTYVPYFGLFFVAGYYFEKFYNQPKFKTAAVAVAALFLLGFSVLTFQQNKIWQNGETLWTHVIKQEGQTVETPWNNRAYYRREQGRYEDALKDYDVALAIPSAKKKSYNSRGKTYFDMAMSGKYAQQAAEFREKAIADYTMAISQKDLKDDERAEALINLGTAHAAKGDFQTALMHLNEGLKIEPDNENGYLNRSLVYFNLQQYKEAEGDYSKLIELNPNKVEIYYERGMVRRMIRENEKGLEDLNKFMQIVPKTPQYSKNIGLAHKERGFIYMQMQQIEQAKADFRKAIELGIPINPNVREQLGI